MSLLDISFRSERKLICRMVSFINLQRPLNTLNNTKENRQAKNNRSNPERVPLHLSPSITPPLRNRARLRLIKDLFENDKAIVPDNLPTPGQS
jgi:hypothetical protein